MKTYNRKSQLQLNKLWLSVTLSCALPICMALSGTIVATHNSLYSINPMILVNGLSHGVGDFYKSCGGVVIGPKSILTAARCLLEDDEKKQWHKAIMIKQIDIVLPRNLLSPTAYSSPCFSDGATMFKSMDGKSTNITATDSKSSVKYILNCISSKGDDLTPQELVANYGGKYKNGKDKIHAVYFIRNPKLSTPELAVIELNESIGAVGHTGATSLWVNNAGYTGKLVTLPVVDSSHGAGLVKGSNYSMFGWGRGGFSTPEDEDFALRYSAFKTEDLAEDDATHYYRTKITGVPNGGDFGSPILKSVSEAAQSHQYQLVGINSGMYTSGQDNNFLEFVAIAPYVEELNKIILGYNLNAEIKSNRITMCHLNEKCVITAYH